jgi:hypothetical protein
MENIQGDTNARNGKVNRHIPLFVDYDRRLSAIESNSNNLHHGNYRAAYGSLGGRCWRYERSCRWMILVDDGGSDGGCCICI